MRSKTAYEWMKRLLCLLLVVCMLVGCGNKGEEKGDSRGDDVTKKPTATTAPVAPTESEKTTATPTPTSAGKVDPEIAEEEQEKFEKYLTEFFVEYVDDDSITLHFTLQHPESFGIELETNLGEASADPSAFAQECEAWKKRLEEFRYEYLTEAQKVNYDRLAYEFDNAISAEELKMCYSMLLSANNNAISNVITCMTEYPLLEEKDVREYISTLKELPAYLKTIMEEVRKDCDRGLYPTEYMLDISVEYAERLLKTEDHPFVVAFEANVEEVKEMSAEDVADAIVEVEKVVKEQLVPATQDYIAVLKGLYASAVNAEGMAHKDGGKEYYTYLAQSYTGSDMTMEEMFEYLEQKLSKSLTAYYSIIMFNQNAIEKYYAADYDYSIEEMMNQLKAKAASEYPEIRDTDYILSLLPEELRIEGVLAYFLTPQYDNPDRKVIRVNPAGNTNNVMLFSTLAHEGYPGHLYQDEFFSSTEGYHPVNALFSYLGYSEGWATMMGANAYRWCLDDAAVAEMFIFDYNYSMTLASLVDIGVNYYGWDVAQVEEFLAENLIEDPAVAEEFYESVVADPAIYLPYMFGYFQCLDIIAELKKEKGLSETEVYEAFLEIGPCPFTVLRKHLGLTAK